MAAKTYSRQSLWELVGPQFADPHGKKDTSGLVEQAIAIILAESGGDPKAVNVNKDGSRDRGLWQINDRAHPDVSDACAFNPQCATAAAKKISKNGTDWTPWVTFTTGKAKVDGKSSVPNADSGFLGTGVGSPVLDGVQGPMDVLREVLRIVKLVFSVRGLELLIALVLGVLALRTLGGRVGTA